MDIQKLSQLSRIKLNKEESDELGRELEEILSFVEKLKEADVENVAELTHPLEISNEIREDIDAHEITHASSELTKSAPEEEDGYVKVKKIL